MNVGKIALILCFAMACWLWQAFSGACVLCASQAQAGMIQNMLDGIDSPPPASRANPTPRVIPARAMPAVRQNTTMARRAAPIPILPQELAPLDSPLTAPVDEIVLYKARRLLELKSRGKIVRHYRVALGRNPIGHKLYQGDNRTPEGHYRIDMRNANSNYYKSLRISYPDRTDQDVALTVGLRPGDWIMIHGLKNGYSAAALNHPYRDWTNGCIALDNVAMSEVWDLVDVGTLINIYP